MSDVQDRRRILILGVPFMDLGPDPSVPWPVTPGGMLLQDTSSSLIGDVVGELPLYGLLGSNSSSSSSGSSSGIPSGKRLLLQSPVAPVNGSVTSVTSVTSDLGVAALVPPEEVVTAGRALAEAAVAGAPGVSALTLMDFRQQRSLFRLPSTAEPETLILRKVTLAGLPQGEGLKLVGGWCARKSSTAVWTLMMHAVDTSGPGSLSLSAATLLLPKPEFDHVLQLAHGREQYNVPLTGGWQLQFQGFRVVAEGNGVFVQTYQGPGLRGDNVTFIADPDQGRALGPGYCWPNDLLLPAWAIAIVVAGSVAVAAVGIAVAVLAVRRRRHQRQQQQLVSGKSPLLPVTQVSPGDCSDTRSDSKDLDAGEALGLCDGAGAEQVTDGGKYQVGGGKLHRVTPGDPTSYTKSGLSLKRTADSGSSEASAAATAGGGGGSKGSGFSSHGEPKGVTPGGGSRREARAPWEAERLTKVTKLSQAISNRMQDITSKKQRSALRGQHQQQGLGGSGGRSFADGADMGSSEGLGGSSEGLGAAAISAAAVAAAAVAGSGSVGGGSGGGTASTDEGGSESGVGSSKAPGDSNDGSERSGPVVSLHSGHRSRHKRNRGKGRLRERGEEGEHSSGSIPEAPVIGVEVGEDGVIKTCPSAAEQDEEDLELREVLGTGSFGTVYMAKWRGREVAVKTLQLPASASATASALSNTCTRERMAVQEAAVSTAKP